MAMMIRNLCKNLGQLSLTQVRNCSVTALEQKAPSGPIISTADYINYENSFVKPREAWIENLDTIEEKKLGLISMHPTVFGETPRTDIIYLNVRWQRLYKHVSYKHSKVKSELGRGNRKPWPQKGTGRARHGSTNSPLFLHGGRAHGPRSHKTFFYMLPYYARIHGLTSTLSVKLAQDDLHIVPNLNLPTDDPAYVEELVETRNWGPSVLFVDKDDIFPKNISLALNEIKHFNMMPVYGLNVHSMLKHNTLVLTEAAVREIEQKILYCLNKVNVRKDIEKYKPNQLGS